MATSPSSNTLKEWEGASQFLSRPGALAPNPAERPFMVTTQPG